MAPSFNWDKILPVKSCSVLATQSLSRHVLLSINLRSCLLDRPSFHLLLHFLYLQPITTDIWLLKLLPKWHPYLHHFRIQATLPHPLLHQHGHPTTSIIASSKQVSQLHSRHLPSPRLRIRILSLEARESHIPRPFRVRPKGALRSLTRNVTFQRSKHRGSRACLVYAFPVIAQDHTTTHPIQLCLALSLLVW
jgi:hypothetical protein